MLRRTKAAVLSDLPPKIIQDFHCSLSPLQARLYNEFVQRQAAASGVAGEIKSAAGGGGGEGGAVAGHIFQALQYLRKLTNHPKMVLAPGRPEHAAVCAELAAEGRSLDDTVLAPKLTALKQILTDAGIGAEGGDSGAKDSDEDAAALGGGGGGARGTGCWCLRR